VSIALLCESSEEVIVMQSLALTQDSASMVFSQPLAGSAGIVFSVLPSQETANPSLKPPEFGL
jgi:hypothetical protein